MPDARKKASDRVKIRWFVGLGAGSDEPTYAPQKAVVDKFNASQDEIELVLEIVDNDQAFQTLATQISGGNAPDVVGPVGIRGRDSFKGAWLDLDPLVKKYGFNLSQFDESMVEFYRDPDDGLIGLPFGIYPSYLYCNKELFEEAGIPLPPKNYGDKYVDENGKEWTWAMVKKGRTSCVFVDPGNLAQGEFTWEGNWRKLKNEWRLSLKFENYSNGWKAVSFLTLFKNTLIYAVVSTFGTLFSSTLVAYGFSRFSFP